MKIEGRLFGAGVVFYVAIAVIYWIFSEEPAGTTALAFTGGMALIISYYVLFTGRRVGVRPEDRVDAEIDEATGEYGFFSPTSWWPLPTAASAAVMAAGLIFGWWLVILGLLMLGFSAVGFVMEYYKGQHSH